jgi:hypothetical protein
MRRAPMLQRAVTELGAVPDRQIGTATYLAMAIVLGACGIGADGASEDYCAEVRTLMSVLDDGGSVSDYDTALERVVDASPTSHREAWTLMLTLSQEEFDYENFNPALDALDAISPELDSTCSGTDWLVVDDDGRVRDFQATED